MALNLLASTNLNMEEKVGNNTSYYPHSGFVYAANKKSLVGSKPWSDLSEAASSIIKAIIEKYKDKPQAKQILFSLVGEDFVAKHYDVNTDYQPHLLEVPFMLPDVRVALEEEFTSILCEAISKATSDPKHPMNSSDAFVGYRAMVGRVYGSAMAEEVRLMSVTGFDVDQNVTRRHGSKRSSGRSEGETGGGSGRSSSELISIAISTLLLGNGFAIDDNEVRSNMRHHSLTGTRDSAETGTSSTSSSSSSAASSSSSSSSPSGSTTMLSGLKESVHGNDSNQMSNEQEARTAPTHSHHSDLLAYMDGTSLVTSKQKWGETFKKEAKAMMRVIVGRCVPIALRRFMMKWRIFNPEHVALTSTVIRRNMAIDKLTTPTISVVDNLLVRATSQTFLDVLRDFDTPRLRGAVLALLNQYFTYSGSQHPSHVCLCIPLLTAFSNQPKEGPYVVSMFHLLLELLPGGGPSRSDALVVARRIVDTLANIDPELFLYLSELVNRARHYQQTVEFGNTSEFAELAVFIKPWVETCLVGFIRREAVLFVWDQCFLTGWGGTNFDKFCIDVLLIIRRKLMEVRSAPELKRAMILLPRRVHTRNLRESFAKRTTQFPKERKLDSFWSQPPLKRLSKEVSKEIDLVRIEKLLAITGAAGALRRHADLQARKNDFETQRDMKLMVAACEKGDVVKAQELLDEINIEVNDVVEDGRTFLYIAAEYSHLEIVELLLDNDADPNLGMESTGVTPLMACIIGANVLQEGQMRKRPDETAAVIVSLCNAGADIDARSRRTILRSKDMMTDVKREKQVGRGKGGIVIGKALAADLSFGLSVKAEDELMRQDTTVGDELTLVPRGSTALHVAVACACAEGTRYWCHPQLVMLLLACGASPTIRNITELTPKQLFEDCKINPKNGAALASALSIPTSVQKSTSEKGGGGGDDGGGDGGSGIDESLLRTAASLRAGVRTGQLSQIKRVMKTVEGDEVALNFIIHAIGGLQTMSSLLVESKKNNYLKRKRKKYEYNPLTPDWHSDCATPIALAARQGYKDVVEALVSAGASMNVGLPGPITPMMQSFVGAGFKKGKAEGAGWEACRETGKWLFENGANVQMRSCDTGETALHTSASSGLEDIYNNLKASLPPSGSSNLKVDSETPDWIGNVPENLLATALGRPIPIRVPNQQGDPLVAPGEHLDDFVEDIPSEDDGLDKSELKIIIADVPAADALGFLHIPLDEIVKDVDQLVGTRTLVLGHLENNTKLAGLLDDIVKATGVDEKKAKIEIQNSVDVALLKKMKKLRDDRSVPMLKARVKNSEGDPVIIKIRALMPGDDPKLAQKLAEVAAKRKGLPNKAIKKLAKHVLAFSAKKTNYSAKVRAFNDNLVLLFVAFSCCRCC